ncbi:palmitoyl protein thioesterase [Haematococcus lacustris]|uniref:Palmitoyl protein thioesterase n=1 Tax=Haematococcus lacustris TaxID=44745 RepID=A0A699Z592_HAELA|nr:palmitoyl protein thioesterase [Haematococcus lacustris]
MTQLILFSCLVILSSVPCLRASFVTRVRGDANTSALPVVLWHGMGDSCCASYSIGAIKAEIEQQLGVYVHSIATGSTAAADVWSSYFGSVNDQHARAGRRIQRRGLQPGGPVPAGRGAALPAHRTHRSHLGHTGCAAPGRHQRPRLQHRAGQPEWRPAPGLCAADPHRV